MPNQSDKRSGEGQNLRIKAHLEREQAPLQRQMLELQVRGAVQMEEQARNRELVVVMVASGQRGQELVEVPVVSVRRPEPVVVPAEMVPVPVAQVPSVSLLLPDHQGTSRRMDKNANRDPQPSGSEGIEHQVPPPLFADVAVPVEVPGPVERASVLVPVVVVKEVWAQPVAEEDSEEDSEAEEAPVLARVAEVRVVPAQH